MKKHIVVILSVCCVAVALGQEPLGEIGGVHWDRTKQEFKVDSIFESIHRVNIINSTTTAVELSGFWLDGPDADEFRIIGTEFNLIPPSFTGAVLVPGDSMWVDVGFKADLSNGFTVRTAFLRTSPKNDTGKIRTLEMSGELIFSSIALPPGTVLPLLHPNPARYRTDIGLLLERPEMVTISVYDVVGRNVLSTSFPQSTGSATLSLDLSQLTNGAYYVRVEIGEHIQTLPLEVKR